MTTPANIRPDAFAGTAEAYRDHRPPYPRTLLDDLLARAAVPPTGATLLDLACGPGRIALNLAPAFDRVLAVDLEPEMVAVGRQTAAERGLGNITWQVGRAEDVALAPGSVDLITIGEAFHRLDQGLIARQALTWLRPGGAIASLGWDGMLDGGEGWRQTVADIAARWKAVAFPAGWAQHRPGADFGLGAEERVLGAAGFVALSHHDFTAPKVWSFDGVVGYLKSTSVCSERALGEHFGAMVADLRAALGDPPGGFPQAMVFGYTLGRKPA
jgi:SAM-dependent methyltransferase